MLTGRLRLHACIASALTTSVGRRYDTLVMEESAQILEIETFIPMLLQAPQDGHNRLKRVRPSISCHDIITSPPMPCLLAAFLLARGVAHGARAATHVLRASAASCPLTCTHVLLPYSLVLLALACCCSSIRPRALLSALRPATLCVCSKTPALRQRIWCVPNAAIACRSCSSATTTSFRPS